MGISKAEVRSPLLLICFLFPLQHSLTNGKKRFNFLRHVRSCKAHDQHFCKKEIENCISVYFSIKFKLKQWDSREGEGKARNEKAKCAFHCLRAERTTYGNFSKCICNAFENAQRFSFNKVSAYLHIRNYESLQMNSGKSFSLQLLCISVLLLKG